MNEVTTRETPKELTELWPEAHDWIYDEGRNNWYASFGVLGYCSVEVSFVSKTIGMRLGDTEDPSVKFWGNGTTITEALENLNKEMKEQGVFDAIAPFLR